MVSCEAEAMAYGLLAEQFRRPSFPNEMTFPAPKVVQEGIAPIRPKATALDIYNK